MVEKFSRYSLVKKDSKYYAIEIFIDSIIFILMYMKIILLCVSEIFVECILMNTHTSENSP